METFDVVVIGAGPGGYPAAIRAAQLGARVAIIEKEQAGGACLNWGCIPSKTMIASADFYAHSQRAAGLGLSSNAVAYDFPALIKRRDRVVETLRNGVEQLLRSNGAKLLRGTASYEARNRLVVRDAGTQTELVAKKTIIATGAACAAAPELPLHPRVLDSRSFFTLDSLPGSVIVLGAGVIGCEFACLLAQLGVRVTLIECLDDILGRLDVDLRRELRRHMERRLAIRVVTGQALARVSADERGISGILGSEPITADFVLAAVGRRPVTGALNAEAAGVFLNAAGAIEADEYGRTCASTIYAIGDVTGGPQWAHAATSQGLVAAENACSRRLIANEKHIPKCIFTSPEIASVGLTGEEVQKLGRPVKTGKYSFAALGRALALDETTGFVKWVADGASGQLLGAHAIGPYATELIAEATLALRAEITAKEFARTVHGHPTLGEAWVEAARALIDQPLHVAPRHRTRPAAEGAAEQPAAVKPA